MADAETRRGTQPAITEIDVLWITAGLGCDGDTIAMTAATQPSIEDIVTGALPWIPKVNFHNPFLAIENGDEFMKRFHQAAEGKLGPFILVIEGSIPDETNKEEGYWASFGTDPKTGQPITTCEWIDRLAPKAWAVVAAGTCATYGGIHAMEGNPTGCMGLADYLGWQWKSKADIPIVCVPGCPVQPDNFMETLLYLLYMAAGRAPMIPLDEALRPTWLFGKTVHEGCDRGGYYEQAQFAEEYGSPLCIVKLGCWGPVVQCNVGQTRLDGRHRRLSECRRNLHRLHHARLSRQVHAVHESAAGLAVVFGRGADLWTSDSRAAPVYAVVAEQRAELAQARASAIGRCGSDTLVRRLLNLVLVGVVLSSPELNGSEHGFVFECRSQSAADVRRHSVRRGCRSGPESLRRLRKFFRAWRESSTHNSSIAPAHRVSAGTAGRGAGLTIRNSPIWKPDIAPWSSRFPRSCSWLISIAVSARPTSARRSKRRWVSRRKNGWKIRCAGTATSIPTTSSAGARRRPRCFLPASRCVRPIA